MLPFWQKTEDIAKLQALRHTLLLLTVLYHCSLHKSEGVDRGLSEMKRSAATRGPSQHPPPSKLPTSQACPCLNPVHIHLRKWHMGHLLKPRNVTELFSHMALLATTIGISKNKQGLFTKSILRSNDLSAEWTKGTCNVKNIMLYSDVDWHCRHSSVGVPSHWRNYSCTCDTKQVSAVKMSAHNCSQEVVGRKRSRMYGV